MDREEAARDRAAKLGLIAVLIAVVSLLHFNTSTQFLVLHEIYQRVYYIPILLAAFWYGPWIGLVTSTSICLIYSYHIQTDWSGFPAYTINQYAEMVLYYAVALITGFLSRSERRQRQRAEETASDLARAYQQLRQTSEQLRRAERLAALGELTAGIAHEIRNPLGSVKGAVEILERRAPEGHPDREFLNIISEEIRRLDQTLSEFLRFARPAEPQMQQASLNDLIDSSVALLREQARQAGVDIQTDLDPRLPALQLDPGQIKQVLLNVMLNGIQAMPQGGVLKVRSSLNRDALDEGRRWRAGRQEDPAIAVIEVSDSGEGLADAVLPRVFDPFFTTKSSGMGLGLSVSHRLIENHRGRISLQPNADRGVTCRVELPLGQSPGREDSPVDNPQEDQLHSC